MAEILIFPTTARDGTWPPIRQCYGIDAYRPEPDEHDAVNEPPYPRTSLLGIMISCAAFWATVGWVWWRW